MSERIEVDVPSYFKIAKFICKNLNPVGFRNINYLYLLDVFC